MWGQDLGRRTATWIGIYLLLVVAPLAALLLGEMPPGREFWWDFSMALGFAGIAMLGVQFALTSRYKRASSPFGIDIIYLFHRYLAIIAVLLVLSHFGILWLWYEEDLGPLDPREARWELTVARLALVLFVLLIVSSEWRKRLRIEYRLWRLSHVILATIGFAAAVAHIVGVGYYTAAPAKRVLWLSVTLFWVLLVVWTRVAKPWRARQRPYRVTEVRPERNGAWTLAIEPAGRPGLERFMPGQFAWLTLHGSPFGLREHPFSIASAPEDLPRIEFGIKELGDFTGSLGKVEVGDVAYLDAPYGVFSIDRHPDVAGFAGIVGGIGVTPMMSMLRSMAARGDKRPVWLFYGNKDWDDITYREEIDALRTRLNLKVVHILEEPSEEWQGEKGFVTKEVLERHLPADQRAAMHYFLCGPTPMTSAADEALRSLGVPAQRIQTEVFELV
jgi:predicted ferric reductase